ncbi:MAG: 3-oxoacyl-[acyl-carrier-protein] synthase III C-terminal domain-containing protein, partial [Dehalococcoidia bacterium]
ADCRLGAPRSEFEQVFGDGAAALLVGKDDGAVRIEASHTHTNELIDMWRGSRDDFVKSWEDRFIITEGYLLNMQEGVSQLLQKSELKVQDVTKAALYAPDARRHREIASSLGLDYKTQVQDPMFDRVGNTGAAFALMLLVAALEEAKDGDRFLLANYGDGCDSFILGATPQIEKAKDRQGIKGNLASKRYLSNYEKYVSHRELMATEAQRRPPMVSSAPVLWRDQKWVLGLNGSQCQNCGRTFFPPQRICVHCRAKDNFKYVPLSERKGTLFTFNKDNLALSADPPEIWCRVHLEGEVGVYCRMTDRDPDQVELEMPVEMTFRKFHEAGGYPNYFWKCRPTRESFVKAGDGR